MPIPEAKANADITTVDEESRLIRTFILQTDASGEDQPIPYFSRKLLPREQAYSTVEKECLAIVLAVKHFKAYLLGRTFIIQTDHRALRIEMAPSV